jgi:hypothetical protein
MDKRFNVFKKIPAIGVVGFVSDTYDIGKYFHDGNTGKALLKTAIFAAKETIRHTSPIGFALVTAFDIGVSIYDLLSNDDE